MPTGTTTVNVSSSSALTTALTNATAGQRILLAAATYSGSFTLSGKSGTVSAGITIEAATPGTAIFASGSTITVNNCAYVTLKGLAFPYELSSGNVVGFRGTSNRCRITRCTFGPTSIGSSGTTKATFVYGGDSVEYIRVDHNEFRNKANPGNAILFDGNFTSLQACKHIRIDHNVIRSIKPEVDNEKEPIRLGVSTMSKTMSYSVVERNFFTDCICEPEIVSVKAGGVRVSGNTVLRSIGGLVYRHGTNGVVNDNYIVDRAGTFGTTIGSGGLRFYDKDHEVSYNYVDGVYGGNFQNALMLDTGDAEGSSTNLANHWRVVNALVERNVLVGNPTGIVIGDNYDSAPTGCTIRDNIVSQAVTGVAVTQKIAPVSTTQTNNAYYPTPGGGGMVQGSDTIWRKAGFGPRLTYLQQADVGPDGDVNDTDGTGTLISGGTTPVDPGTATTAAEKFGWGAPLPSSDEFEYTGAPAATKWSVYDSPGHDDNGVRSPARVTVANGKMILTGLAGSANTAGLAHKLDQTYGRWEARARSFYTSSPTTPGTLDGGYHPVCIVWPDDDTTGTEGGTAGVPVGSTTIFQDGFESGNFSKWSRIQNARADTASTASYVPNTYHLQVVNDGPAHPHAARFEVRDEDIRLGGERSEILGPASTDVSEGDRIWVEYDVKHGTPWATPTTGWCNVMQWHHDDDVSDGSPPLSFTVINSNDLTTSGDGVPHTPRTLYRVQSGVWRHVVHEIKFSASSSVGYVKVWVDGVNTVDDRRATMLQGADNYFKMGIYRDDNETTTTVIYYDNIRFSTGTPTTATTPVRVDWPYGGEYDWLENGEPGQQAAGAFLHYPSLDGADHQIDVTDYPVDLREFHNFAFEWTPDGLKGWIDGNLWYSHSGGAAADRKALQAMHRGHMTVQLDAFQATGCIASTMELEWVRVYSLTPSGPVAGPQSLGIVGIGSAEAFGIPTVTGAIPSPPSGSVVTRLGQNTVLGASTLGYTSGSVTPTPPGVQTVSGAGGIASGQVFGRPVLTVEDGPQTIAPTGIASQESFGRPRVLVGPPASPPAPGGVLVPTLFAVAADGITLSPLPAWESMTLSPVRNSAGSVEIVYPAGAPGFQMLHDAVSASPLRALEIRVWLGGNATGAVGGWLVSKSGDDLEPGSLWRFSGHFHEWILSKAIIAPQAISEANKSGALLFAGATAGLILSTVMDQAQARGALPLVSRDFTTTHDSNGDPWAKAISSLKLAPKTTIAQVADKLVELAMCEYEFTAGRVWRAFNPGGRGTDRTTGLSTPLTFAAGVDLSEAARRESVRDAGTAVLVAGSEGYYSWAASATAQAQLGWRAEVGVDAGQLNSQSAVQAVAPSYLETASAGVAERNAAVEFGLGAPLALIDYAVGDWAYLATGTSRERMRIAQVVLEFGKDAPARGKVVFNDLITDRITALYRRLNAISTGDAVVGTSESTPGGSGEDTIPPAAPIGVTVASTEAYQQPGESETYALVIVGWAPVTTNAYADAETADKVRAAGLIADRLATGQTIAEDWTWSGAPAVVGTYNDALLEEAQSAGLSGIDNWMFGAAALAWLADYAVTHGGGGAVTDDVAHYRVQWRYTGSQVVPSRQDPGNGVPGEPTPPRDPDAFPEDAAWFEPGESPTTTNRIEFGGVLAGRAIQVRVCAVDRAENQGPWSGIVGIVTAIDNRPPPAPSKPIATAWFRTMDITWDGKGSSGEDMFAAAPDIARGGGVEVHVDTGIDFTPHRPLLANGKIDPSASRTYKDYLSAAMTTNVVDLTIGTTYYARFVAVDQTGNASEPSETSDGVLPKQLVSIDYGPDTIERATIRVGAIGSAQIDQLAVNDAHIDNVNVGKLRAGTMSAQVVVGGRFSTPLTNGNQLQFDNAGIRMYRGGTVVGRWEVFDGSILITGQYNSAVTGQRIIINPGGGNPDTIRFYPTFSDVWSSIDSVDFQGGTVAGIRIVGSGTTATANRGMLVVRDQYASMVHGRTDLSYWGSEIWVEQNFTRNKSATVDLIVDERLTSLSGPRRVAMIHYNSAGQPINATGLYYQKTGFNGGEPHFYANGMDVGFVFAPGLIYVRNNPNGDFRDLTCRTLNQASGAAYKRGIRDLGAPAGTARAITRTGRPPVEADKVDDPIELLRQARPRRYRWHDDTDDVPERAGFIAEEMPYPIRVTDVHPSTEGDRPDNVIESIDYSALTAVLAAAVKQLDARVDELESMIDTSPRPGPDKERDA